MDTQPVILNEWQTLPPKHPDKTSGVEHKVPETDNPTWENSATALNHKGFFWEAADLALKAYHLAPDNLRQLEQTVHYCEYAGKFHQAKALLSTRYRLAQGETHPHDDLINQVVNFMDEKLITDDDLEKLIKTVMSIPHKHHLYQFGEGSTEVYLLEDEYSKWYHYGVKLRHIEIDEVVELCLELSDTLAEVDLPTVVTNNFVPSFHLAEG